MEVILEAMKALSDGLPALTEESAAEGFRFRQRLTDNWRSGANRFINSVTGSRTSRKMNGSTGTSPSWCATS